MAQRGSHPVHVTSPDLRLARQGDLILRFAILDRVAYVLAELPDGGATGTTLEAWCEEPHWGVVLRGELEVERAGRRTRLTAGRAFHIGPGAPPHRFAGGARAIVAGFAPLSDGFGSVDAELRARGYDTVGGLELAGVATWPPTLDGSRPHPGVGRVLTESAVMGPWMLSRATHGRTAGIASQWCDAPHWGMVLDGAMTIDYEDDVEVLAAGDVYYCPPGPPGHHFDVADHAVTIDFTPLEALGSAVRLSEWRARGPDVDPAATQSEGSIELV